MTARRLNRASQLLMRLLDH